MEFAAKDEAADGTGPRKHRVRLSRTGQLAFPIYLYLAGCALIYLCYFNGSPVFPSFVALFIVTFAMNRPSHAISPLSVYYAYYGVWYVLAPMFAERFEGGALLRPEYGLALAFIYTTFGLGVIILRWGEIWAIERTPAPVAIEVPNRNDVTKKLFFLYCAATLAVAAIVQSSGGLAKWIDDPGKAFLTREGSGAYVILSHFSSLALAALSGYHAYTTRKRWPLLLFIAWVMLTSAVHGSKAQISLLIVLLFTPWIKDLRFAGGRALFLYGAVLGVFFLGTYFRNLSWIDAGTFLPYALNYFNTLEMLAISIEDFPPQFLMTFFLPFVKFATPFGLADSSMYYDMNHLLTDIYFPKSWEIRATEQWPVETDLYLNFFFWGGLPLLAGYLFVIGAIYGRAIKGMTLGAWFAAVTMSIFMISHLRGSLLNHIDFYMYPYIWFMYRAFANYTVTRSPEKKVGKRVTS